MLLRLHMCKTTAILLFLFVSITLRKQMSRRKGRKKYGLGVDEENLELRCLDFITVSVATQNFAHINRIGKGGFGPVYKGNLPSGQEIAVKRLAENSSQGIKEFKNVVMLIAKLQHRNLVGLLGYCIYWQEKMLICEHMPNGGSLDTYIFDGWATGKAFEVGQLKELLETLKARTHVLSI